MKRHFLIGFLTPFIIVFFGILIAAIFSFWIGILGLIVFGLRYYTLITISLLWIGICVYYGIEEVRDMQLIYGSKQNKEFLDYKRGHEL